MFLSQITFQIQPAQRRRRQRRSSAFASTTAAAAAVAAADSSVIDKSSVRASRACTAGLMGVLSSSSNASNSSSSPSLLCDSPSVAHSSRIAGRGTADGNAERCEKDILSHEILRKICEVF